MSVHYSLRSWLLCGSAWLPRVVRVADDEPLIDVARRLMPNPVFYVAVRNCCRQLLDLLPRQLSVAVDARLTDCCCSRTLLCGLAVM